MTCKRCAIEQMEHEHASQPEGPWDQSSIHHLSAGTGSPQGTEETLPCGMLTGTVPVVGSTRVSSLSPAQICSTRLLSYRHPLVGWGAAAALNLWRSGEEHGIYRATHRRGEPGRVQSPSGKGVKRRKRHHNGSEPRAEE
jgi:hypothetical protein